MNIERTEITAMREADDRTNEEWHGTQSRMTHEKSHERELIQFWIFVKQQHTVTVSKYLEKAEHNRPTKWSIQKTGFEEEKKNVYWDCIPLLILFFAFDIAIVVVVVYVFSMYSIVEATPSQYSPVSIIFYLRYRYRDDVFTFRCARVFVYSIG